jgi:hypothetical protein
MSDYELALAQLATLESFKHVESNLPDPPVTMPQGRLAAAGADPALWYGLGIVGVWAVMDAFADRKGEPKGNLSQRFGDKGDATRSAVLDELDDLRNLFAHNFAGVADHRYVSDRRRLRLKSSTGYVLSCGLHFSGLTDERVRLTLSHFLHYIEHARAILVGA